jgi:hypothetical protein
LEISFLWNKLIKQLSQFSRFFSGVGRGKIDFSTVVKRAKWEEHHLAWKFQKT